MISDNQPKEIKIGWWSAGITSAIACKIALEMYSNIELIYIETGKSHHDNFRFKQQCEEWYGVQIRTVQNSKGYKDPMDVAIKDKYINGPEGARCTLKLKKEVRYEIESMYKPDLFNNTNLTNQIFGFEFDRRQINRAIRFQQQYPSAKALFPLIEKRLSKNNCAAMLEKAGIDLPEMYKLGYANNNCIGCVKGGKGYWNKIRKDFPDVFTEMSLVERLVGHSCIKGTFLDELNTSEGNLPREVTPECGTFCEIEFAHIESKNLNAVMNGALDIYRAADESCVKLNAN